MNSQNIKNVYVKLVCDAINKVDNKYFNIKVAGADSEKRRERVFCYELYHCMRKLQEELQEEYLTINGEIDKSGHFEIKGNYNPDFVIHKQGGMDRNEVVVEVKCNFNKAGIKKDFGTIRDMMKDGKYKNGVFVLIGYDMDCFKEKIFSEINNGTNRNNVYVFCKKNNDSPVEVVTLDELNK